MQPDAIHIIAARRIHTMGADAGDALAIADGQLVAVGPRAELRRRWPDAPVHDLSDATLVPGFVDAHHHLATGALLDGGVDCSTERAPDIAHVQQRIAAAAAGLPAGSWILARGYDPLRLAERRPPTRAELDAAAPHHALLLVAYGGHEAVANSHALRLCGIDRHTADPPAGHIERGRRGVPTGRLFGEAYSRVEARCVEGHLRRAGHDAVQWLLLRERQLLAAGITHVCDPAVSSPLRDLYRAGRRAGLAVGLTLMPCSDISKLTAPWDRVGQSTGGWDAEAEAHVGPTKVFLDGGEQCEMCFGIRDMVRLVGHLWRGGGGAGGGGEGRALETLREARPRPCRHGVVTGQSYVDDRTLERLLATLADDGQGVALHAIGNRAVGRAQAAIAATRHRHAGPIAPRIEHAVFMDDRQLDRAADLGLILVPQPAFVTLPSVGLVPPGLSVKALPLRSALDRGVVLAGGSDAPVADFDVLYGMARAVDRRGPDGRTRDPDETLDRRAALAMYTTGAAQACGLTGRIGALTPGARADFVALSADPLDTRQSLEDIAVQSTWIGGEQRWCADDRTAPMAAEG